MEDIINQIQEEILDVDIPLSPILLKAKVLSYKLGNDEFKNWVKSELDGYPKKEDIPRYRIIQVIPLGYYQGRFHEGKNIPVPTINLPDWLQEIANTVWIPQGVRSIEQLANSEHGAYYDWQAEWVMMWNSINAQGRNDMSLLQARSSVSPHVYIQILDTVRSRLQDFMLEISDLPWEMGKEPPSEEKIQKLVQVTIFNNPEGGSMSIFDQRGQRVDYQFNAAGDINIDGIDSKDDFISELEKLRQEFIRAGNAGVIDEETILDGDYHVRKAILEAKKSEPSKKSIIDQVGKAKALFEDFTAATGLVIALMKAAEIASSLF